MFEKIMRPNVNKQEMYFTLISPKLGYNNRVFTYSSHATTKTNLLRKIEKIKETL